MTSVDFLDRFLSETEIRYRYPNVDSPPSWGIALDSHVSFNRSYGSFLKWEVPPFFIIQLGVILMGNPMVWGTPSLRNMHINTLSESVTWEWHDISYLKSAGQLNMLRLETKGHSRSFKRFQTDMSILEPKVCVPDLGIDGIDPI